ncbi:DNA methyltransferase [Chitinophaga rhizosphaerae]|uniref:DNA methyltransferase n=1 Tax=Chitinophaga rhizosphaerae TaxID=1864947 RepID=UPI000F80EF60|nr:DNA methyltransferase [Chitinophaga rhizosphaerae]
MINVNHDLTNKGYSNYENTMSVPRHRWYFYKEGFSPLLVEKAIEVANVKPEELIIDPFNGSGTTTLTSSLLGFRSTGIEVNPFTSFLSDAKTKTSSTNEINRWRDSLMLASQKKASSPLMGYSTFSKAPGLEKWLFNDDVLMAFEGAWASTSDVKSRDLRKLLRLSLISSAMQNCNARRDGKCMKYKESWKRLGYDRTSFQERLFQNIEVIKEDINSTNIKKAPQIINGDSRTILKTDRSIDQFKLCITSPPYLNTFDYTDIYRPELFLGKFVKDTQQLYDIRLKTVRSHIQAKWKSPEQLDFGLLFQQVMSHVNANRDALMDKSIPTMIQAYFEDIYGVLKELRLKASKDAQVWFVVSNSAYADLEVPVDLIIGDIGAKAGWFLQEIGVLRYLKRRKTKYSPSVENLRESVIVFSAGK